MKVLNASSLEKDMVAFLKSHEDTSLFLLGNYESYGTKLGPSFLSGNYKLILDEDQIVAVFSLTKMGNLLVQSDVSESIFQEILKSCKEEEIPIKGLIGPWNVCEPFWDLLKREKIIQKETYGKKDILYTYEPTEGENLSPHIRLLTKENLSEWLAMRFAYLDEEGFPEAISKEELSAYFLEKVEKKIVWGYFVDDTLVAIADLNAKAFDLGQVGGVYTLPAHRRKGYSKAIMRRLFHDCKKIHAIRKLIIFTGVDNLPARTVYESIGCTKADYFALFFGEGSQ